MSYTAVYEVTQALRRLLHSQLVQQNPNAVVTLLPPGDALPRELGVNLYLYRVLESPFTRNRPWPGDRKTAPSDRPALGLQLYYLLTPIAVRPEDSSLDGDDAHTMLGAAMLTLQENPVLNDVHLPDFDADIELAPDLLNSYEQVKLSLAPISLEEMSKIWSAINQPYRLSVAYEVALIELTPTPPPPVGGGIVLSTGVKVITLDPPRLTELTPISGALVHITGNAVTANELRIGGFGFSFAGQTPIVRVGGQLATIKSSPARTDQALTVDLPPDLDAGPQADVRVTLNQRTSTPLTLTVSPWLATLKPIRTALDPARGADDLKLVLKGNGFTANPRSVRFGSLTSVTSFDTGASDTSAAVTIPANLHNGLYDIRLVLNDAASSASNSRTLEVIPHVNKVERTVVTPSTPPGSGPVHELTLNGARLDGNDIRLLIDGSTHLVGPNTAPAALVYRLGRLLSDGSHRLAVNVDGHGSRAIDFNV